MRYPLATSVVPSRRPGRTDRDRGPGAVGFSRSRFWIVITAMTAFPLSPASGGESIWTHNGSTLRWVSSEQDRWLYYFCKSCIGPFEGTTEKLNQLDPPARS
jgi:hypothetical protein